VRHKELSFLRFKILAWSNLKCNLKVTIVGVGGFLTWDYDALC